jgi:hypothetical protein
MLRTFYVIVGRFKPDAKQQQLRLLVKVRFAMRVPAKLASMVSIRRLRRPPPRPSVFSFWPRAVKNVSEFFIYVVSA